MRPTQSSRRGLAHCAIVVAMTVLGLCAARPAAAYADATHDELLNTLAGRDFAGNIVDQQKRSTRLRLQLASLTAAQASEAER